MRKAHKDAIPDGGQSAAEKRAAAKARAAEIAEIRRKLARTGGRKTAKRNAALRALANAVAFYLASDAPSRDELQAKFDELVKTGWVPKHTEGL